MGEAICLQLSVSVSGSDVERLDATTHGLREELVEHGFHPDAVAAKAPNGAKGDPSFWGTLAIAVLPTLLPKLIELIRDWTRRDGDRVLTIQFKKADGTTTSLKVSGGDDSLRSLIAQLQNSNA